MKTIKLIIVGLFLCVTGIVSAQNEQIYKVVEKMPVYNNDESGMEFRKFIAQNVQFPEVAKKEQAQATIFVQFLVNSKGEVKDVEVLRVKQIGDKKLSKEVNDAFSNEAIRVVKLSEKWTPGKQKNEPVTVQFVMPINFKLN